MSTTNDVASIQISTEGAVAYHTTLVTVSLNRNIAAETFVDAYYAALQNARPTVSTYYQPQTTMPDGKVVPVIVWNGNVLPSASDFQKLFENDMPATHFDAQSLDCHIINPSYAPEGVDLTGIKDSDKKKLMSLVVMVSGTVKVGERGADDGEVEVRGFSEVLTLVPNIDKLKGGTGKAGQGRSFLIQNQNFRYVV